LKKKYWYRCNNCKARAESTVSLDDALNKLNAIPCDDFDGHHHATQYGISEYWE